MNTDGHLSFIQMLYLFTQWKRAICHHYSVWLKLNTYNMILELSVL